MKSWTLILGVCFGGLAGVWASRPPIPAPEPNLHLLGQRARGREPAHLTPTAVSRDRAERISDGTIPQPTSGTTPLGSKTLSEAPPDLPDGEQVGRDRRDLEDAWERLRDNILRSDAHLSEERLAKVEERKATYLQAKAEFLARFPAGTVTFSPPDWQKFTALSESYEHDMDGLIGHESWKALKAARADLIQQFARGGYTLPLEAY